MTAVIRRALLGLLGLGVGAWGAAALWIDGPASRALAAALAAPFLAASLFLPQRFGRGLVAAAALWAALLGWWLAIPPSNARDWLPDVAHPPTATITGNLVTLHNVRNFVYRSETDYTPRWETRTYDLRDVRGLDIFLSKWGSPYIAHTIVSWEFANAPPLAISIETRKERGEVYSAVLGFFRQFELYYVIADERDVIGVRAIHRGERVALYRLAVPPDVARALLVSYLHAADEVAREPQWYNALSHNCTTTIRLHVLETGIAQPWDYRILVNGLLPEMFYERKSINTDLSLPAMLAASDITERTRAAGMAPDFSARIRDGLPPRPPFRTGSGGGHR
jgi:hypothetical protein